MDQHKHIIMKKNNQKPIKGLLPVPKNFCDWNKPKLWASKPEKVLVNRINVSKTFKLGEYSEIPVRDGFKYRISMVEQDYGGCYYESDNPSLTIVIEEYTEETIDNPDYEKQLKNYNTAHAKYKKELKEYNENLKNFNHNKKLLAEEKERQEFERLKEKYEPN